MTINALARVGAKGRRHSRRVGLAAAVALTTLAALPRTGVAATYSYVDWMTADVAMGTAAGTITLPDNSTVTVTFAAINQDGTPGSLYGAQVTEGETNYWNPAAPYISPEVENAPPGTDILQLLGGLDQTYKVTLSEPIKDPVMAIVSLGSPSITITYDFDSPFTIVSQGAGYWGGGPTALVQLPGNVLQGTEGHGTIRFIGTFSTFSWTVPMPEGWHGFTFGIRTTERIEPTEAGAPDALTDAGETETDAPTEAAADAPEAVDAGSEAADAAPEAVEAVDAVDAAPEAAADTAPEAVDAAAPPADVATHDVATHDVAQSDAGTDSKAKTSEGGCSCAVSGAGSGAGRLAAFALLALVWFRARRRR